MHTGIDKRRKHCHVLIRTHRACWNYEGRIAECVRMSHPSVARTHTYQLLFLECRLIAKDGTHLFGVHSMPIQARLELRRGPTFDIAP